VFFLQVELPLVIHDLVSLEAVAHALQYFLLVGGGFEESLLVLEGLGAVFDLLAAGLDLVQVFLFEDGVFLDFLLSGAGSTLRR
jgi:hypothetical protein